MEQKSEKDLAMLVKRLGMNDDEMKFSQFGLFFSILEKIKKNGAVIVVKLDGQRTNEEDTGSYTSVISGGALGENFIRIDDESLENALLRSIRDYVEVA